MFIFMVRLLRRCGRSSEYGRTGGSYRTYGHSGGKRSEYVSIGFPIACMGRAVEGVLNMEVRGFL